MKQETTYGLPSLLDDGTLDGLTEAGVIRNRRPSAWHTKWRREPCRRSRYREAGDSNKCKTHVGGSVADTMAWLTSLRSRYRCGTQ